MLEPFTVVMENCAWAADEKQMKYAPTKYQELFTQFCHILIEVSIPYFNIVSRFLVYGCIAIQVDGSLVLYDWK